MSTERAFEQAILASPEDDALRLVYADWLEEQGDLRGEYLRVETALARTAPNDPGYRPLRGRVTELRERVDRAWGTTFGLPKITGIEDLVYYLREFHKGWSDSPGLDPASLPADLPYGLALVYRELGALTQLTPGRNPLATQDTLAAPSRLVRSGGMVRFAWENQGNWVALAPTTSENPDPLVYSDLRYYQRLDPPRPFTVLCDSLNCFLITLCLQEAVMSAPRSATIEAGYRHGKVLNAPCRTLWANDRLASDYPMPRSFFDVPGQDLLIMELDREWMFLGTHSETAWGLIRNGVPYERTD
jgi:uncharacterized protein (TIGR02996 family)